MYSRIEKIFFPTILRRLEKSVHLWLLPKTAMEESLEHGLGVATRVRLGRGHKS